MLTSVERTTVRELLPFEAALRRTVEAEGLRPFGKRAEIPVGIVRSALEGRDISTSSLRRLAGALGLEFHVGPRRRATGAAETHDPATPEDRFRSRLLGNIESHSGAEIAALLMVSDTMLAGGREHAATAAAERAIARLERAAEVLQRGTGDGAGAGDPERDLTRKRIAEIRRKMAEKAGRAEPPRAADLLGRPSLFRPLRLLRWFLGEHGRQPAPGRAGEAAS